MGKYKFLEVRLLTRCLSMFAFLFRINCLEWQTSYDSSNLAPVTDAIGSGIVVFVSVNVFGNTTLLDLSKLPYDYLNLDFGLNFLRFEPPTSIVCTLLKSISSKSSFQGSPNKFCLVAIYLVFMT